MGLRFCLGLRLSEQSCLLLKLLHLAPFLLVVVLVVLLILLLVLSPCSSVKGA
jgi:hypothetical protein